MTDDTDEQFLPAEKHDTAAGRTPVESTSRVRFHELLIRDSDDGPDTAVVGRADGHQFIELPRIGTAAIHHLDNSDSLGEAETLLEADQGVRVDLTDLVESLMDVGFVRSIDDRRLDTDEDAGKGTHLPWLRAGHVRWIFGPVAKVAYASLILAALATLITHPVLLPSYKDFFWHSYVGLVVVVNTVLFLLHVGVHEFMHLAAARSLRAPARIGLSTRLYNLTVQTDVTAVWGTPRRFRYRVYLAGLCWDFFVVSCIFLLVAHADLGTVTEGILSALVLGVLFSVVAQAQMYMRTDLYFVLLDALRCRDLFHDGMAYFRYLARRGNETLRPKNNARAEDPTSGFSPRERRAVRVYAVVAVVASVLDVGVYLVLGIPILVETFTRGFGQIAAGIGGQGILPAIDGTLVVLVEGTLLVLFLVMFVKGHRHWFRRRARRAAQRG